jgi:flagellar protein FliS
MLTNPYEAYEQGSLMSQSPMQLIVALYEAGISAVQGAKRCLEARDIMGRTKAITKAVKVIGELQISLNHDKPETKEMSAQLGQLYGYMTQRLQEAHLKQIAEPLVEVEGLLRTMVEGWYVVVDSQRVAAAQAQLMDYTEPEVTAGADDVLRISYGGYYREPVESYSAVSFSF